MPRSAGLDADTIRKHVSTHLADADPMARDDFEAFFAARARALLGQIGVRARMMPLSLLAGRCAPGLGGTAAARPGGPSVPSKTHAPVRRQRLLSTSPDDWADSFGYAGPWQPIPLIDLAHLAT
jgi:hypothetical protein